MHKKPPLAGSEPTKGGAREDKTKKKYQHQTKNSFTLNLFSMKTQEKQTALTVQNQTVGLTATNLKSISVEDLLKKAEDLKGDKVEFNQLPNPETIPYLSIRDTMKINERRSFVFVGRIILESVDAETGEATVVPTVILLTTDGTFVKNQSLGLVKACLAMESGNCFSVLFTGTRKSKTNLNRFIDVIEVYEEVANG